MADTVLTNRWGEKISKILVFAMPLVSVAYYLWIHYRIPLVFYVNNYSELSYIGAFLVITGNIFTIFIFLRIKKFRGNKIKILGISIFVISIPVCCLGSVLSLSIPTVLDTKVVENTTYYLTGEIEEFDIHAFHRLYKCHPSSFFCEQTPFWEGGGASFRPLQLMVDETSNPNEINVTWTPNLGETIFLGYTYGKQPRYYDYPAQLNDNFYYLAYHRDSESKLATYTLYKCKLDNTSCKQLPIVYEGFGYSRDTVADESTDEINVFISNPKTNQSMLIFTWGENPRCYVDGCEILDTTN